MRIGLVLVFWISCGFFFFSWFLFRGDVAEADADLGRNGMTFFGWNFGVRIVCLHVVYCQNNGTIFGAVLLKDEAWEGRDIEYLVTHSTINDEPSTTGGLVSNSALLGARHFA